MSAHIFEGKNLIGILHLADIYQFGGYIFEYHPHRGPSLCKKDLSLYSRQPGKRSKFWIAFDNWLKLSEEKKEETQICG